MSESRSSVEANICAVRGIIACGCAGAKHLPSCDRNWREESAKARWREVSAKEAWQELCHSRKLEILDFGFVILDWDRLGQSKIECQFGSISGPTTGGGVRSWGSRA